MSTALCTSSKKLYNVKLLEIVIRQDPTTKVKTAVFELDVKASIHASNDNCYLSNAKYEINPQIQNLINYFIHMKLVCVNIQLLQKLNRVEQMCKNSPKKETNFWYRCDTLNLWKFKTPLEFSLMIDYPHNLVITEQNKLVEQAFYPVLLAWNS